MCALFSGYFEFWKPLLLFCSDESGFASFCSLISGGIQVLQVFAFVRRIRVLQMLALFLRRIRLLQAFTFVFICYALFLCCL